MLEEKIPYFGYLAWHQYFFLLSLILLALASLNRDGIPSLFKKDLNNFFLAKESYESKFAQELPLFVFSFLQLSLFLFINAETWNDFGRVDQSYMLAMLLIVAIFLLVQWLLERLIIYVSEETALGERWQTSKWTLMRMLGLVFFALNLFAVYLPKHYQKPVVLAGIVVLCLAGVLLAIRLLKISLASNRSIWFIILYFCALEIMPIALLLKRFVLAL